MVVKNLDEKEVRAHPLCQSIKPFSGPHKTLNCLSFLIHMEEMNPQGAWASVFGLLEGEAPSSNLGLCYLEDLLKQELPGHSWSGCTHESALLTRSQMLLMLMGQGTYPEDPNRETFYKHQKP